MSVGPTRGPVQRPGADRDFTEIFQRLDDLERVLVGSGWRFLVFNGDTGEVAHGWGWLITDDSVDHGYGETGLLLADKSEAGIQIIAQNAGNTQFGSLIINYGSTTLDAGSGHPLSLRGDQVQITDVAGTGAAVLPDGPLTLQSFTSTVQLQSGDQILMFPGLDLKIALNAGQKLQVVDSADSPIFEVREDGTVHIKTGTTILADL